MLKRLARPHALFSHHLRTHRVHGQHGLHTQSKPWQPARRYKIMTAILTGIGIASGSGIVLYDTNDLFRYYVQTFQRSGKAIATGTVIALDYQWALMNAPEEEKESAKSACHKRSAQRVLDTLQSLGGIYIKWGQHISSMIFVLPEEWTSTLAVLQDRCERASSPQEIRQLIYMDTHHTLEDLFSYFDFEPIGVASLAQVHRARLKETGEWVAVKIQHPKLDEFCRIDINTVSWIFDTIQSIFPNFGFYWVAEDMRESLPQELDFSFEAENARKVTKQFAEDCTSLVVPKVLWADRRIICMEYICGTRIDDLEYMKKHHIDPSAVSTELISIFSQMMFLHGFVHCDPHPGNIMIRANENSDTGRNFDIVLLDHGVYRTLSKELRVNYAHLWTSLIEGDEDGIERYCALVGGCDHRLFASMLTGREWHTIRSTSLSSARTTIEIDRVANKPTLHFFRRIADILSSLPRVMLLLLKTGDLLRNVDELLRNASKPGQYRTYAIMGQFCAKAVWVEAKQSIVEKVTTAGFSWQLVKRFAVAWWNYHRLEYSLWAYNIHSSLRQKLSIF
ncbi:ABC1 family-domain-containing protein [Phascolomyces articulosus]|uniref:ABC1 family-domain-containing protein n=1 Tax=Phascolomyces articulosus TaxID=60185 RepID=A0AAD5P8T9_9FUNG|nr:ABC1 family-domain-containing protein [Phascolomyces articulosus]